LVSDNSPPTGLSTDYRPPPILAALACALTLCPAVPLNVRSALCPGVMMVS